MNFNPEGDLLAFAPKSKDGSSLGIHIASPFTGDEPVRLSTNGYFPSFSFDGKWISFFKYNLQLKNTKIYITLSPSLSRTPTRLPAANPSVKRDTKDLRIKGGEAIEIGQGIYPRWAFNKTALVYEMLGVRGGIYVAELSE